MGYTISQESLRQAYPELEPIFREHYAEMASRLRSAGVEISPYSPRFAQYFEASEAGWLKTFVARCDGEPVGYSNVYLTNDMHNGDFIAQEDTIYVLRNHRKGLGRALIKHVLAFLREAGVKRLNISATTDLRVIPLFKRMGFKEVASQMTYTF